MSLTIPQAFIAIFVSAAIIYGTRVLSFLVFNNRKVPALVRFIEKYTPSLIMAVLVMYCFKDINFSDFPYGLPFYAGIAATILLHLTVKNTMISIFGSTIIYIVLTRLIV